MYIIKARRNVLISTRNLVTKTAINLAVFLYICNARERKRLSRVLILKAGV